MGHESRDVVEKAIPTPDHAFAAKSVLVIEDDDGLGHFVSYDHIRQLLEKATA